MATPQVGETAKECVKKKKSKRGYQESFIEYGFIEAMDKVRAECIFCRDKLANESLKPCKLKRHQTTKHPETVGKPKEFFLRKKELLVANRPQNIKDSLLRAGSDHRQATITSFDCSLLIAKDKKPHTVGETLIKPACIKMAERMCGPQVANKFKTVPLSNNTVKDRIDRMAGNVENTLVEKLKTGPFSIQLDETTTVAEEAILIVYAQYIEGTEFVTSVVSCSPAELKLDNNGKKEKVKGFNVILKDTILFPEGGGQPDDHGTIEDVAVVRVLRQGADAVHFIGSALDEGHEVRLKVDWERRFDHMQQHSGQHLITALADTMFGYKTTSWELSRQRSSIELDTVSVKPGEMEALEDAVNDRIRAHVPVNVRLLSIDDPDMEEVRSRGLPDDHAGPIRIIDIEGVDANMCCGTHVSNLSHLQVIKILGTEKGKKNKTNLIFIAGNRVLKYAEKSYNTEKALTSLLKTGPDEHVDAVDKLQKTVRRLQKSNLTILRDLAVLTAQNFKSQPERSNFFSLHNKDGDNEFMNIIANEIGFQDTIIFLTVGEEKGAGLFLLAGPENLIAEVGPRVLELLQGKGAGKNGRFQGKTNSLAKRAEVEALLQSKLNQDYL